MAKLRKYCFSPGTQADELMKYRAPIHGAGAHPPLRVKELTKIQAIALATLKEFADTSETGKPLRFVDKLQTVQLWMNATKSKVRCFAVMAYDHHYRQWVDPLTWV